MGGVGSGNWHCRLGKKRTVEESLALSMTDIRKHLIVGQAGSLTWTWTSGRESSVGYFVTGGDGLPVLNLHYRRGDEENLSYRVQLEVTDTQFGGVRWWFTCPLIVRGIACDRRAGKLYLPPGAKYFGCRKCHELTYRSCQEAHSTERVFARMGFDGDTARIWDRMHRSK